MLSTEVQEIRRRGIAATDAAPIMGLSPWKSHADVWIEKKQPDLAERKETPALYWGNRHEKAIAEEYAQVTGQALDVSKLVINPKVPWMMCSPDRLIRGKKKGLECKTASGRVAYLWGPSGTDRVPQHYLIQVAHSMMVLNYHEWDLAVLIDNSDFRIYHLFRNKELMSMIYQQEAEFYSRFIAGGETPEFDWGKEVAEYVRRKYPQHEDKEFSVDDHGDKIVKKALEDLLDARGRKADATRVEATQKALVQAYMGTHGTLLWKDKNLKINWRTPKDSEKIDWHALCEEIYPHLSLTAEQKQALIAKHTEKKTGARRFTVYDGKDEEE